MVRLKEESPTYAFQAFVATQFLGAFNDNAFKQLILLLALDISRGRETNYQFLAVILFALPFVLFSGIAGNVADRHSKTRIIFWAKVAEIVIMGLGVLGFWLGDIAFLLCVLFLMGTQSAFFGPAKYGILPEMLPRDFLSRANGIIMMTTFLAVILGQAVAGILMDDFPDELYLPAMMYTFLAVGGTLTALGIRKIPSAQPDLPVLSRPFGDLLPTLKRICLDRSFLLVVFSHSSFWFLGAVMQPTVNEYGMKFMDLKPTGTSYLLVTLSIGLAAGGILGGLLSRRSINFQLTRWGMIGVIVFLGLMTLVPSDQETLAHAALFFVGLSGSLFGLPLQTYIQQRPREGEKGRVVAAANFSNWVFICLAGGYYYLAQTLLPGVQWIPVSLAVCTVCLGLILWPRLKRLQAEIS